MGRLTVSNSAHLPLPAPLSKDRAAGALLYDPLAASLELFCQRRRRERLGKIRETSRLKRSLANGRGVVSSHVDDCHCIPSRYETVPQVDA